MEGAVEAEERSGGGQTNNETERSQIKSRCERIAVLLVVGRIRIIAWEMAYGSRFFPYYVIL